MSSLKIYMVLAAILAIVAVAGCTQKGQQAGTGEVGPVQDLNKDVSSADAVQNDIAAPELAGLSKDLEGITQF